MSAPLCGRPQARCPLQGSVGDWALDSRRPLCRLRPLRASRASLLKPPQGECPRRTWFGSEPSVFVSAGGAFPKGQQHLSRGAWSAISCGGAAVAMVGLVPRSGLPRPWSDGDSVLSPHVAALPGVLGHWLRGADLAAGLPARLPFLSLFLSTHRQGALGQRVRSPPPRLAAWEDWEGHPMRPRWPRKPAWPWCLGSGRRGCTGLLP